MFETILDITSGNWIWFHVDTGAVFGSTPVRTDRDSKILIPCEPLVVPFYAHSPYTAIA